MLLFIAGAVSLIPGRLISALGLLVRNVLACRSICRSCVSGNRESVLVLENLNPNCTNCELL